MSELQNLIGRVAETNRTVGDFPKGHQVIIAKILDPWCSPHLEVEQRGRRGSCHLHELEVFEQRFEV